MSDYQLVQARYAERLSKAIEIANGKVPIAGVVLTKINHTACTDYATHWHDHPDRIVRWDWRGADHRPFKGLSLAIWHGGHVCGLASGKLSNSKAVRIDYIESRPDAHGLRSHIIPITLTCADAYRILIGADELRLQDVSEELIPVYERHGFRLAPESGKVHVMHRTW